MEIEILVKFYYFILEIHHTVYTMKKRLTFWESVSRFYAYLNIKVLF